MTNTVRIVPRSVKSVPAQDSASVNAAPGAVTCHRCYSRAQLTTTFHTNMTGNNLLLLKETVARDRLFQIPPINMTVIAIVRRQHTVVGEKERVLKDTRQMKYIAAWSARDLGLPWQYGKSEASEGAQR